jgi:ABC-type glycerol-3-phosphate transport system substrate-binding protein
MVQIRRRKTLQLSAAGAVTAATGGLAGILASGRAPALAQTQTMHWLRWADFVPASDQLLKGDIVKECEKDLGMKLTVETINGNDIQARITAAIQSGAGPDIFCALNNWPQLYGDSCADVGDVVDEIGKAQGGYYDACKAVSTMGNKWIGAPWAINGGLVVYRKSWLAEAGSPNGFPTNWDDYRAVGKKLKAAGHPYGQTAGHTFGDAPGWWYPYLWSWGGKEVEADGKTVALNTQATVESVKFAVALWKETMDEGGLAWDDTSNNRAFLSGSISATNNGASIYLESKKKPDSYQTEKGTPMKDDMAHASIPGGAGGHYNLPGPFTNLLMKYSKNQDAAKKFLTWISSKPVFEKWFVSQQGFSCGPTKVWEEHPVWSVDPILAPFKQIPITGRMLGWAGPPNQKAAEVQTKYIIVDMYAKAIQGMNAEDSVKAAHAELVKVYGA